jgi:hypothetical protein
MAENTWSLQDGRSILVEFEAPTVETNWGWFGMRSSGEGMEFATAAVEWTDHAWLRGGQYIMAAEIYVPPIGGATPTRMLMGIGA